VTSERCGPWPAGLADALIDENLRTQPGSVFGQGDEYLTIAEVASILKVTAKRIRNMMSSGAFRQGDHFFRRRGLGPRFSRARLDSWLRDDDGISSDNIPMARTRRRVAPRPGRAA
jgi:hypothetical protein